ncbi:HSF-type DNA-binding-domain-containing protein [Radiomyces spectabilis]|uniref:HSF-type DNA-binding-domain-containing protein n=1 Tax=Radiomyces spectabilis TaxID=64574 RepID=UPI00221FDC68|nr:HSF-type DNA-binding-domain-containing protein [Radiomyces spectabilis]KAI8370442.1 HSF-type DNA-binding-domain-containing protein [Radiomyces spectabilis]
MQNKSPSETSTSSSKPGSTKTQAAFVNKLYKMVEDPSIQDLISWSEDGDLFSVANPTVFSRVVLPQYFKHNNWQSFVRQLNMYGFHKVNDMIHSNLTTETQTWEFKHPHFRRGAIDDLQNIKRKSGKPSSPANARPLSFGNGGAEDDALNAMYQHITMIEEKLRTVTDAYEALRHETTSLINISSRQQKTIQEFSDMLAMVEKEKQAALLQRERQRSDHDASLEERPCKLQAAEVKPASSGSSSLSNLLTVDKPRAVIPSYPSNPSDTHLPSLWQRHHEPLPSASEAAVERITTPPHPSLHRLAPITVPSLNSPSDTLKDRDMMVLQPPAGYSPMESSPLEHNGAPSSHAAELPSLYKRRRSSAGFNHPWRDNHTTNHHGQRESQGNNTPNVKHLSFGKQSHLLNPTNGNQWQLPVSDNRFH